MSRPLIDTADGGSWWARRAHPWISAHVPELAGAAVIGVIALSIILTTRYLNQVEWVRHSLDVQTKILEVRSAVQDMVIGQRSYVLTGDERFAGLFAASEKAANAHVADLHRLVIDNPPQIQNVDAVGIRLGEWEKDAARAIDVRRSSSIEAAKMLASSEVAIAAAAEITTSINRLADEERALLDTRTAAATSTIRQLAAFILFGILATVASLATWIFNARLVSRELRLANEELVRTVAGRDAAEDQVRQMQKMEAIGQLTGGIAHDFNNMLAIIMSSIALAERSAGRDEANVKRFLSMALEGAQRAANLVKRLMAFARVQPLSPQPIDANKIVSGLSELIGRSLGAGIEIETVLGGGLWVSNVDAAQLENSILNLCVNGRDAMHDGGRLTVETANCHLDDLYSRAHPGVPAGQYVLLAVTDTGAGMTPEVLAKAFDPFFTTKEAGKGTGLGLSQVYGFVKQTGGHIKIYSEPDHGTTVKIYLPRYYATAEARSRAATSELKEVGGNETILVVDDEKSVLELTAATLEELGYRVIKATSHDRAVEAIENGPAIALLLTDIIMPVINGRKLAEKALALRPGLRVLFMTGFTRNAIVHHGVLDAGVHFLAKPFTMVELSHKVRQALDGAAAKGGD